MYIVIYELIKIEK